MQAGGGRPVQPNQRLDDALGVETKRPRGRSSPARAIRRDRRHFVRRPLGLWLGTGKDRRGAPPQARRSRRLLWTGGITALELLSSTIDIGHPSRRPIRPGQWATACHLWFFGSLVFRLHPQPPPGRWPARPVHPTRGSPIGKSGPSSCLSHPWIGPSRSAITADPSSPTIRPAFAPGPGGGLQSFQGTDRVPLFAANPPERSPMSQGGETEFPARPRPLCA